MLKDLGQQLINIGRQVSSLERQTDTFNEDWDHMKHENQRLLDMFLEREEDLKSCKDRLSRLIDRIMETEHYVDRMGIAIAMVDVEQKLNRMIGG